MRLGIELARFELLECELLGLVGICVGLVEVVSLQVAAAHPGIGFEVFRRNAVLGAVGGEVRVGLGEGLGLERDTDVGDDVGVGGGKKRVKVNEPDAHGVYDERSGRKGPRWRRQMADYLRS